MLRMLTYDGQTAGRRTMVEGQTASNEDRINMHMEDDDVDLKQFQEKRNKDNGKVPTEQNNGNKKRYHDDRTPEEKILPEQN
jgi:hypothetical protein